MKRLPLYVIMLLAAITTILGCGGDRQKATPISETEALAATVGDWKLSRKDLLEAIEALPEPQHSKYDTNLGRAEFADRYIEEELWYRDAVATGLEDDDEVKKMLADAHKRILVGAYYKHKIEQDARPSDQEIHDYYDEHQDQYTTLQIARAQHVFNSDKDLLEEIKLRVVEGGEKFTTMAHKYSQDKMTKGEGGDLGYINPGGYMRGVGYSEIMSEAIFSAQPGEVIGPIKWERGYSLVRVNELRPAALRPYDEVEEEIAQILIRDRIDAAKARHFEELKTKYHSQNFMRDIATKVERSAVELWNYAQSSDDMQTRLETFQEIVDTYPNDEYAAQAMFMVGFVYAEEMGDPTMAGRTWARLIDTYPDSDVAETARWMIDNMGKPLPDFDNLDDLNEKLKSD